MIEELSLLRSEQQDLRIRLKRLAAEVAELRQSQADAAIAASASVPAGGRSPSAARGDLDSSLNSVSAARRAESAADAAEASAAAAVKLRQELEEILRAVDTPSMGDDLLPQSRVEGTETPLPALSSTLDVQEDEADEATEYVERQREIEARLNQLEDQLDSAGGGAGATESDVFQGLKGVVKDVKRCLQRCELLFQLPEIKSFVKRFRRALEMNAILHERWLGPAARRRKPEPDDDEEEPGTGAHPGPPPSSGGSVREEGSRRLLDHARSAPDLAAPKHRREAIRSKKGDGKKKPFRTVVDWCRPHTPLTIDPVSRGHGQQQESTLQLPQIARP